MLGDRALGLAVLGLGLGAAGASAGPTLNDITNWTGTGANRAALVVHWKTPEVMNNTQLPAPVTETYMVWGYRFDGTATAGQMLNAVLAANPKLYATEYNGYVAGLGYDLDADGQYGVTRGTAETTFDQADFTNGKLSYTAWGDADKYLPLDGGDLFWAGHNGPNWETWHELGGQGGYQTAPDRGASAYWTADDPQNPWSGKHGQWELNQVGTGLSIKDGSWFGFSVAAGGLVYGQDTNPGTIAYNEHKTAPIPEPAGGLLLCATGLIGLARRRRASAQER